MAAERSLQSQTDLWLLDATHQIRFTRRPDGSLTRLPVWSPDGTRIAFASVRSGSVALSTKPSTQDGDEDVLFASPETKVPCDWSPDGRFLVYDVPDPKTGTDLWLLPVDTRMPSVFLRTGANERWGAFSPDGRWMAYQSNETGRYEVYVTTVSCARGADSDFHGRRRLSAMVSRRQRAVLHRPRRETDGCPGSSDADDARSGRADDALPDAAPGGGSNVIGRSHQYDVARDGRFLINVDAQASAPPITLLMNWTP